MKCYHCGMGLPEDAKYCGRCGKPQRATREMIDAAKRNDQEACADLYWLAYGSVYYKVKALVRNEDVVMDILQDSFLQAFQKLDTLQEPEKFQGWICAIARNRALDWLRKRKEIPFTDMGSEDDDFVYEAEDLDVSNLPELRMEREEVSETLAKMLSELPEKQKIVMTLYCEEQYTEREIAEELGISINTVKSCVSAAKKKLKKKADQLEKRGISLRGLTPIAFLAALFRTQEAQAAVVPDQALLQSIQSAIASGTGAAAAGGASTAGITSTANGVSAAGATNAAGVTSSVGSASTAVGSGASKLGTAASVAGKTAATAGKGILTKVLAGVVLTGAVTGAVIGGYSYYNSQNEPQTVQNESAVAEDFANIPDDAIEFNGHYYKVYYEEMTWTEAKEACEEHGGHLVTITSQEEQDFIESITDGCLWIGLYRHDDEEEPWYWVTGEALDYENWAEGEPNDSGNVVSNENRAVIYPDEWNDLADANMDEQAGYICEWE